MTPLVHRLRLYGELMRMNRPIGIFLILWPMLWALWIAAGGDPSARVAGILIAGTIVMRAAGCVINDYLDREIDARVERTKGRPLADGRLSPREALWLFAALALIALLLALQLNRLTILLALVAFPFACCYPLIKRLTHLPQIFLGVAFGWAAPIAFAAQTGAVPPGAWLLFSATVLWTLVYDTMYAMVDRDDDLKIGVKSSAILLGRYDRLGIALAQIALLANLYAVGRHFGLGAFYDAGLVAAAGLALYHQWLIRARRPESCLRAFRHNSWLGAAVFVGAALNYV